MTCCFVKQRAEVVFVKAEIEGEDYPEVDDLILNIDGCFYRVKRVEEDIIETTRLTLQGTGVGGGGSGGGSSSGGEFRITLSGSTKVYASEATTMPVGFTAFYSGTDDNYIA